MSSKQTLSRIIVFSSDAADDPADSIDLIPGIIVNFIALSPEAADGSVDFYHYPRN